MKKRIIASLLLASMLTAGTACSFVKDVTEDIINSSVETDVGATTETSAPETEDSETEASESSAPETAEGETAGDALSEIYTPYDYMGSDLSAFIEVGTYEGLSATKGSALLTEEEYREQLKGLLESHSYNEEIRDRAVEAGDTVVTSFAGYLDGVQFEGGTSASSEVTAADGTGMIDGFGPAFVGQMPGVEFSFKVTFPTVYGNLELAGKEVTFICTVDYIKGDLLIPELTDEFVRANYGMETVEVFEEKCREMLAVSKAQSVEQEVQQELWAQVMEGSTVLGYPEGEVDWYAANMLASIQMQASMYQMSYADFVAAIGYTEEQLQAQAIANAETSVKEILVICQIAKAQGLILTDERIEEEAALYAASYGVTTEEFLERYDKNTLIISILQQDVLDYVVEKAIITEE